MRTIKITLRKQDPPDTGHDLTLELLDPHETRSCVIPEADLVATRPKDDNDKVLDEDGIRELMLRESPLPSEPELERIGDYLGALLLYGDVGAKWDDLRVRYPGESQTTEGLGVLLEVDSPELQALPWELARRDLLYLFDSPEHSFARIPSRFNPNPPEEPEWWPLRVAVIIGAAKGDVEIDVEDELEHVFQSLALLGPDVSFDVIERPADLDALYEQLDELEPHILHFIGHGVTSGGGDGRLVIMAEGGRWEWSAAQVGRIPAVPRIAVLNACRSGDVGDDPQQASWHVADAFARKGTAAVLAMQGDIQGEAAAAFSAGFYDALADDANIDVCVATGRSRAARAGGRDFALPTLTLSRPADRVLPLRLGSPPPDVTAIDALFLCDSFVDRQPIRRKLLDQLGGKANVAVSRLAAIDGEPQVGKSELVRWALRQLARRGRTVYYVDLRMPAPERKRSALGVLSEIRDSVQSVRGDDSTFSEWNELIKRLTNEPVIDIEKSWNGDPHEVDTVFKEFLNVLRSLSETPPVVALDHVDAVPESEFKEILNRLVKPVVLDPLGRVILVLSGDGSKDRLKGLKPGFAERLTGFDENETRLLVSQYFRIVGQWSNWTPEARDAVVNFARLQGPGWKPTKLKQLADLVRRN